MLGNLAKNILLRPKNLRLNAVRNSGHGGIPGENLPFPIGNPEKLTALWTIFFGSGFAAPYLVVLLQMYKKMN